MKPFLERERFGFTSALAAGVTDGTGVTTALAAAVVVLGATGPTDPVGAFEDMGGAFLSIFSSRSSVLSLQLSELESAISLESATTSLLVRITCKFVELVTST